MRIGILGMGGIGSFVGAKLVKGYENDNEAEIIFICRGKTKKHIINQGLTLISENKTITVRPDIASNEPEEIGFLDILIIATKSYSLPNAISQYQKCLKTETVIIPLQNGVNAKDIINKNIDHENSKILEGSIYVASNIEKPGIVNHVGGPGKIFFGNDDELDYKWIEKIINQGGLDVQYTKEIKKILWTKYLFVSPLAAITTAFDIAFGELAENSDYMNQLEK